VVPDDAVPLFHYCYFNRHILKALIECALNGIYYFLRLFDGLLMRSPINLISFASSFCPC
jgi:hypothetical protein